MGEERLLGRVQHFQRHLSGSGGGKKSQTLQFSRFLGGKTRGDLNEAFTNHCMGEVEIRNTILSCKYFYFMEL